MTMDTKALLVEAEALKPQLLTDRRTLHHAPEVGPSLPRTAAYVTERLTALGYTPRPLAGGVVADITGEDTGRCVLLRADMDALRVREATGLDFQSENDAMHACGHDMHAAMLLGAAALLKRHQADLKGTVRLVFQPDEEGFTGAKSMLAAGVLKDAPTPKAALALHVNSGTPSGMVLCGRGTFMAGCTLFRISVRGTGCHGDMPETGVDPINIAAHIYLALQALTAREISAKEPAVVTIGHFQGGQAPNIIPEEAVMEGTIRTFDRELTARIMERIRVIAENTAAAFRGSATVEEIASAPPLVNDPALMEQVSGWAEELAGKEKVYRLDQGGMGSEDFASFTYELPCAYLPAGGRNAAGGSPLRQAHAQRGGGVQRGRSPHRRSAPHPVRPADAGAGNLSRPLPFLRQIQTLFTKGSAAGGSLWAEKRGNTYGRKKERRQAGRAQPPWLAAGGAGIGGPGDLGYSGMAGPYRAGAGHLRQRGSPDPQGAVLPI